MNTNTTININTQHWQNLIEERELPPEWVEANCRSIEIKEASELLHYQAKSDGLLLESANGQQQFKPDQPWSDKQGKKAPKYRTPYQDNLDAMLPIHPHDPNFWSNEKTLKQACWSIDGVPCLIITEGLFKAIQGTANNLPTIALTDIENGLTGSKNDPESQRYPVDQLRTFAELGFGFIFAFDANYATNKKMIHTEKTLATKLEKFEIPVYSITGTWSEEDGKGMDDLIQNHGIEAFREKLIQAEKVREKYNNEDDGTNQPPKSGRIGEELADKYRANWVYCSELSSWMIYELEGKGIWSMVSYDYISHAVLIELKSRNLHHHRTNNYMNNIMGYLKDELFIQRWDEKSDKYLPFKNGVYELATGKFYNHSPGFRLTWKLPRNYCKTSKDVTECPTIFKFIEQVTGGNSKNINIIFAFMAAILKGKNNIQKFLYLLGSGGSGKSTLMDMITELIGDNNATNFNLEELEDKHNIIDLFGKRLLNLPDQPPINNKKSSNFKRLTGNDYLSGRRMRKDVSSFKFKGLAVLTSNQFCFPASANNWLNRRMILVECSNVIPKPDRELKLMEKIGYELPYLTTELLNWKDESIEQILLDPDESDLTPESWQRQCQSDGLAAWINDELVKDMGKTEIIGNDKSTWERENYDPETSSLYASYCHYCRESGHSPKTSQNFSSDLLEILNQMLGWNIEKRQQRHDGKPRKVLFGVRLRTDRDYSIPLVEDTLKNQESVSTSKERIHSVSTSGESQTSSSQGNVSTDSTASTNNRSKTNEEILISSIEEWLSSSNSGENVNEADTVDTPPNNETKTSISSEIHQSNQVDTPPNNESKTSTSSSSSDKEEQLASSDNLQEMSSNDTVGKPSDEDIEQSGEQPTNEETQNLLAECEEPVKQDKEEGEVQGFTEKDSENRVDANEVDIGEFFS